jgi:hypothetical protein
MLRILVALAGSFLFLCGAERLFIQIGLADSFRWAALFCLLSSQMTWATLAHVGNDWLAVPLSIWALSQLNQYAQRPSLRSATMAACIVSAGLLTKAHFLAFVPLLLGLCLLKRDWREVFTSALILCASAGPWYIRNVEKYGVLTGMQECRSGIGLGAVLSTAPTINWLAVIPRSVRWAIWTGNNSFLTFSAGTVNALIVLYLVAFVFWALSRHFKAAEWITLSYCLVFVLALGYAAIQSYIFTGGAANGPSPWYAQVLSAPLIGLAFLGTSRRKRVGCVVAECLTILCGYILIVTYVVKLIPLYGGQVGRGSIGLIGAVYFVWPGIVVSKLNSVTLAPAAVIITLTGIVVLLAVAQVWVVMRSWHAGQQPPLL